MYVTRPLSLYQNNPSAAASSPPDGPNGGYLVLQDDSLTPTHFSGLLNDKEIEGFPFPQNKLHDIVHRSGTSQNPRTDHHPVYFIPAINHPLSSNIYYAIKTKGKHKGKACTSSSGEEMTACCLGNCLNDVDPTPLDPSNTYQQFKVELNKKSLNSLGFKATSIAHDGHPPQFLRSTGWILYSKTPKNFCLGEAKGIDLMLRAHLPDFDFSVSYQTSNPVVVGKWHCPFMFIKEQLTLDEQVKQSMYYEMTLEQQWNKVFYCENTQNEGFKNTVFMNVVVPNEGVMVEEADAIQVDDEGGDKVVWFSTMDGRRVGLSSLIVERMKWEEERVGWVTNERNRELLLRKDKFRRVGTWERYGCYILVERFVLKRMDGSVLLTYNFNHIHQLRSKWE